MICPSETPPEWDRFNRVFHVDDFTRKDKRTPRVFSNYL